MMISRTIQNQNQSELEAIGIFFCPLACCVYISPLPLKYAKPSCEFHTILFLLFNWWPLDKYHCSGHTRRPIDTARTLSSSVFDLSGTKSAASDPSTPVLRPINYFTICDQNRKPVIPVRIHMSAWLFASLACHCAGGTWEDTGYTLYAQKNPCKVAKTLCIKVHKLSATRKS